MLINKNQYLTIVFFIWSSISSVYAQISLHSKDYHVLTKRYAQKDDKALDMDIYYNGLLDKKCPAILFIYGSGFVKGRRDDQIFEPYFNSLLSQGFKVVAMDYRLELSGKKKPTLFNTAPLRAAIDTAVKDAFDATVFLINNRISLGIDTGMIILSGSSAGAITVLHADYNTKNSSLLAGVLPDRFQYRGVIAFAGAILSYSGMPKYATPPAPTMFFHGTKDKVVPYNKIRFLNRGFFGSRYLSAIFRKNNYPYYFQFVQDMGHEIGASPMTDNLPDIQWFIENYIFKHKKYFMEVNFRDAGPKRTFNMPVDK